VTRPLDEVHAKIEETIRDWRQLLREWEMQNEKDPVGAITRLDERWAQRRALERHLERLWLEKRLVMVGEDVALARSILAKLEGR